MSSQAVKPTCAWRGKKHFEKCIPGIAGCFGCGKDGHKVSDCHTIADRGRESKKDPPSVLVGAAQARNHFYVLQAKTKSGDDAGEL